MQHKQIANSNANTSAIAPTSSSTFTLKTKPQLHTKKCHQTYNGTRTLPRAIWIRSQHFRDPDPVVYEILLYYKHNRACTIFRTAEDFRNLKYGIGRGTGDSPNFQLPAIRCVPGEEEDDVEVLQRYLCEAISKKRKEGALEYFLRRRGGDCGGA